MFPEKGNIKSSSEIFSIINLNELLSDITPINSKKIGKSHTKQTYGLRSASKSSYSAVTSSETSSESRGLLTISGRRCYTKHSLKTGSKLHSINEESKSNKLSKYPILDSPAGRNKVTGFKSYLKRHFQSEFNYPLSSAKDSVFRFLGNETISENNKIEKNDYPIGDDGKSSMALENMYSAASLHPTPSIKISNRITNYSNYAVNDVRKDGVELTFRESRDSENKSFTDRILKEDVYSLYAVDANIDESNGEVSEPSQDNANLNVITEKIGTTNETDPVDGEEEKSAVSDEERGTFMPITVEEKYEYDKSGIENENLEREENGYPLRVEERETDKSEAVVLTSQETDKEVINLKVNDAEQSVSIGIGKTSKTSSPKGKPNKERNVTRKNHSPPHLRNVSVFHENIRKHLNTKPKGRQFWRISENKTVTNQKVVDSLESLKRLVYFATNKLFVHSRKEIENNCQVSQAREEILELINTFKFSSGAKKTLKRIRWLSRRKNPAHLYRRKKVKVLSEEDRERRKIFKAKMTLRKFKYFFSKLPVRKDVDSIIKRSISYSYLDPEMTPKKIMLTKKIANKRIEEFQMEDGFGRRKCPKVSTKIKANNQIRLGDIYFYADRFEYPYKSHYLFNKEGRVVPAEIVLKKKICSVIVFTKYSATSTEEIKIFDSYYKFMEVATPWDQLVYKAIDLNHPLNRIWQFKRMSREIDIRGRFFGTPANVRMTYHLKKERGRKSLKDLKKYCGLLTVPLVDSNVEWTLGMQYRHGSVWYVHWNSEFKWYFLTRYRPQALPCILAIDKYGFRSSIDILSDLETYGSGVILKWSRTDVHLTPLSALIHVDRNNFASYEPTAALLFDNTPPQLEKWNYVLKNHKNFSPDIIKKYQ